MIEELYIISKSELEHIMDDVEADRNYKVVRSHLLSAEIKKEKQRVYALINSDERQIRKEEREKVLDNIKIWWEERQNDDTSYSCDDWMDLKDKIESMRSTP